MKMEHAIQAHIVTMLRAAGYMTIDCDVMAALRYLPAKKHNDPRRFLYINQHKALGYTIGQPDLVVVMPQGGVLFAELKNGKIGRQSDDQKKVQKVIEQMGHTYVVWRTVQDAIDWLKGRNK